MGAEVQNKGIRSAMIEEGLNPDTIREFLQQQIEMQRAVDKSMKEALGLNEYYKRERGYTELETFIFHLKQ